MCGTCGCKSAESGKKNCGCGQDPCKTFGVETFEARDSELKTLYAYVEFLEEKFGNHYDEFVELGLDPYRTNDAETFEARTTRKGGKHDPTKTVRDGAFIYTHKKDGIPMDYDNQKVRKLGLWEL